MRNSIFGLIIIGLFFTGCEDAKKLKQAYNTIQILKQKNQELEQKINELETELDRYKNRTNRIKEEMFSTSKKNSISSQIFSEKRKCVQGNCTNGTGILEGQGYIYQGDFKDSKLVNGTQDKFFSNGNKEFEGKWKEGLPNGKVIVYYENGKKQGEGYLKNGKQHGWFFEYSTNGDILEERYFKDGIQQ